VSRYTQAAGPAAVAISGERGPDPGAGVHLEPGCAVPQRCHLHALRHCALRPLQLPHARGAGSLHCGHHQENFVAVICLSLKEVALPASTVMHSYHSIRPAPSVFSNKATSFWPPHHRCLCPGQHGGDEVQVCGGVHAAPGQHAGGAPGGGSALAAGGGTWRRLRTAAGARESANNAAPLWGRGRTRGGGGGRQDRAKACA